MRRRAYTDSPFAAIAKDVNRKHPGRYMAVTYPLGWRVRDDGDIETCDGVVPLEEFAAAGRIDGIQLEYARDIKMRWLAALKPCR